MIGEEATELKMFAIRQCFPLALVFSTLNVIFASSIIRVDKFPRVVIVGGGPSGLVSALTLHDLGWRNIVVLEKRSRDSYRSESTYTYGIDGRGQKIFKALNLTPLLKRYGVHVRNGTNFVEVQANGKVLQNTIKIQETERFYVLRNVLLDLLLEEIDKQNSVRSINDSGSIKVLYDCNVHRIQVLDNGKIEVSYL